VLFRSLDDNDKVLKPKAIWKLERALEQKGDRSGVEEYRARRLRLYPDWQAPAP